RKDLLELEGDEEDRAACIALLKQTAVHEFDRADVEATRRLRRNQHLWIAVDLPREDNLLLVAAGERACGRRRRATADVELLQQLARPRRHRAQVQKSALRVRRLSIRMQREVLGQGER